MERINNKGSNVVQTFISTTHHTHAKYGTKYIIIRRAHLEPDLTNDTEICVGVTSLFSLDNGNVSIYSKAKQIIYTDKQQDNRQKEVPNFNC